MPIYEFRCRKCSTDFEELVYGSDVRVSCPSCGSRRVAKKLSTFGMSGVEKPFAGTAKSGCGSCSSSSCSSCKG